MENSMQILLTDKGNFLVKRDNLCAFFNPTGNLLREAKESEWEWAKQKMEEVETEVNFDFSSLEEKLKQLRTTAIKAISSFTGLGEDLVAGIISQLGITPEALKLSGQMNPNWESWGVSTGGCMYSHESWVNVWAVSHDGQIVSVKNKLIEENADQNADGSWSNAYGCNADYLARTQPQAEFFIVNDGYKKVTDHGSNVERSSGDDWEIYTKPNMHPIWEEAESMAITKLDNFLKCLPNSRRISEVYPAVKEKIGISDKEITAMLEEEIGPGWIVSGVSTGGCAYSDNNNFSVWAFNNNGQLEEIADVMVEEKAGQNANGSWSDGYGYYFKYLRRQAPRAIFFIMKEEHEFHADRQQSRGETVWHLLRPLTRKEIMIQKINAENSKTVTLSDLLKK